MNVQAIYIYGFAKGRNLPLTMKAVTFAYRWHKGQKRDDGNDYIGHPITVCRTLINHNIDDDATLAAAILHDVKEDSDITDEELVKEFGQEVAKIVDMLTKREDEHTKEYYQRVNQDIRAIIIKAADRAHNIGNMIGVFSIEKLERYVQDTAEYILPIMKQARRIYLEYSDALVAFRDHIRIVIRTVRAYIEKHKECERLRQKIKGGK